MTKHSYTPEMANQICQMVAEGRTLRQISADIGFSMGTILNWVTKPEHVEQYAAARDAASDIFETEILEAALAVSPDTAAADRVKIDALKWAAAKRSPKKYGERVQNEHTGANGAPIEHAVNIAVTFHEPDKAG